MKLWHVDVHVPVIILAEGEEEAKQVASEEIDRIMACEDAIGFDYFVMKEITDVRDIPFNWEFDSVPYGGDGEKDIQEYLDEIVTADTKTIDMFEVKE